MEWIQLPIEIKLAMFLNQALQGNPHSKDPFVEYIGSNKDNGGFDWDLSIEGNLFWDTILYEDNIDHFYTRYPKIQVEVEFGDMQGKGILTMSEEISKKKGKSYSFQFSDPSEMLCKIPFKDLAIKGLLKDKIKENKKRLKILNAALDILLED